MEIISASAEDRAGTSCFREKNFTQPKTAPETESRPQEASQNETIFFSSLSEQNEGFQKVISKRLSCVVQQQN